MANDYSATLALDYLKEKQIAVPERVAMIAFDNTLDAMEYQLTSYDFNNTGIVNTMLRYILSPSAPPATGRNEIMEVEGSIVERRSTLRI
jgi:DNA-binding LacI/PurR family transcriptional regulator